MATLICFFNENNTRLFDIPFWHDGNSHWTMGQVLTAVKPRLQLLGLDVDNINFTINGNERYNEHNLVTSFDIGGRIYIRVDVDQMPVSAPRLTRQNAVQYPLIGFRGSTKRRKINHVIVKYE